ncbi:chemotaxis protein [Phenylobacterium zucineum HLK1]|uniref:Chemotaxis protein n=1 Tax=Phenylobacterium zucineum (strain HLK1) TaxID=450851 RepID=B4RBD6_PHEZH|nr:response regulator [Phenylobacterium zucineum]ACG79781.1 chemotaxis protein [Phenylobacterium zucineum HLK1]
MSLSGKLGADPRLNLAKTVVLIVQNNQVELDLLGQVFIGFGVKAIRKYMSIPEADEVVKRVDFDLIVVDGDMPNGDGFEFVRRIRAEREGRNRLAPILLVAGHTPSSSVLRARDCGASFVVAKPITPKVLFDRMLWLVQDEREFVECDTYVGPDRRHKHFGPPPGMKGRRQGDLSPEVGFPAGPDLAQSEIDALLNPKKAVA